MARKPGVSRSSGDRRGARARVGESPPGRLGTCPARRPAPALVGCRRFATRRTPPRAETTTPRASTRLPIPRTSIFAPTDAKSSFRKRRRVRASTGFSLVDISDRFAAFVLDEDADVLTLPPYSKHQVVQIASLATIYGLDARLRRGTGRAKDDVDEDEGEDDDERQRGGRA